LHGLAATVDCLLQPLGRAAIHCEMHPLDLGAIDSLVLSCAIHSLVLAAPPHFLQQEGRDRKRQRQGNGHTGTIKTAEAAQDIVAHVSRTSHTLEAGEDIVAHVSRRCHIRGSTSHTLEAGDDIVAHVSRRCHIRGSTSHTLEAGDDIVAQVSRACHTLEAGDVTC